jgi:hypothetical protein
MTKRSSSGHPPVKSHPYNGFQKGAVIDKSKADKPGGKKLDWFRDFRRFNVLFCHTLLSWTIMIYSSSGNIPPLLILILHVFKKPSINEYRPKRRRLEWMSWSKELRLELTRFD